MSKDTDAIRFGKFTMAYGHLDVVLTGFVKRGLMSVLVFAWAGSGFPPDHHSLN
jgi:hypothetical protein